MTPKGADPSDPRPLSSGGGFEDTAGQFRGASPRAGGDSLPRTAICTLVEDALIVASSRHHGPTVVDAAGAPVVDAALFRHEQPLAPVFVDRAVRRPDRRLPGCHLFAGLYWPHFGHFLIESLSRLWAFDALREQLDGIVFLRSRGEASDGPVGAVQRRMLDLLGIDAPIRFVEGATAVDRLLVPRHGCGLGAAAAGIPEFRDFVHHRLRAVPRRNGADRIYISRMGFDLRRGGVFAEEVLEPFLREAGYLPYCPERETLEDQVATYLGARQIISTDNSALHLFGFVGDASQEVAILLRREDGARDMRSQLAGFTGRAPVVIDAIRGFLVRDNARTPTWGVFAELDFPALSRCLAEAGFLPPGANLPELSDWRRGKTVYRYQRRLRCDLREVARLGALPATEGLGLKPGSD